MIDCPAIQIDFNRRCQDIDILESSYQIDRSLSGQLTCQFDILEAAIRNAGFFDYGRRLHYDLLNRRRSGCYDAHRTVRFIHDDLNEDGILQVDGMRSAALHVRSSSTVTCFKWTSPSPMLLASNRLPVITIL